MTATVVKPEIESIQGDVVTVIRGMSWETCRRLLDETPGRRSPRIFYWKGVAAFVSPSYQHEQIIAVFRKIVEFTASEDGIEPIDIGATTLRKDGVEGAAEADEAFYLTDFEQFAERHLPETPLNLATAPPPDLVIEVDITSRSDEKIETGGFYATIGVGEIWRWDVRRGFTILVLEAGTYSTTDRSRCLPRLSSDLIAQTIEYTLTQGRIKALRWFKRRFRETDPNRREETA